MIKFDLNFPQIHQCKLQLHPINYTSEWHKWNVIKQFTQI